ncbi:MAG: cytochrome c oxidase subunit II [Gammaproteobacteria bacterium]|nr:cytochrome c oxidase subunit II [Gammaproteobacteria bacterium]
MSAKKSTRPLTRYAGPALVLATPPALADYKLNFQEPVSSVAHQIYDLHMLIFWICVAIAVAVFGAMFISIYRHRKSKGAVPAQFHENTKLEFLWTIIPFAILVAVAIPATKVLLELEDTSEPGLTIKVTGMQWKWKYEYDGEGVSFISTLASDHDQARRLGSGADVSGIDNYLLEVDNQLVVPTNTRVRFLVTSNDVIHSWWVQPFGVKKDAIPGFVNETWTQIEQEGVYRGQCAELCGKDHAFMPIVVRAVSQEKYDNWLAMKKAEAAAAAAEAAAEKVWSKDELMSRGQQVYQGKGGCVGCHGPGGEGVANFPALTGSAVTTGPVPGHLDVVINGRPGTAMAAFGPQLNDLEIAAAVTYERNALGNQTGDVVQPADVKAAR